MAESAASLRNYFVITGAYWGFTVTDGAIRMLVVLYFHQLGYSPLDIAFLFLFYEFFGVVTNLVGGWIGSRVGLSFTLYSGMGLQVVALAMLAVDPTWLSVGYVMFAQALSGIAKDLNKMSAKASVKLMLPENVQGRLFKWVAVLTGSKNSLKGAGYFLGGFLLALIGFQGALLVLAGSLFALMLLTMVLLPGSMGRSKSKAKFTQILSKTTEINWLSAARFFLFGARDIWFVVGLPVFFVSELGWGHTAVGSYMALWIIGYGIIQALAPKLLRHSHHDQGPDGVTARLWVGGLVMVTAVISAGFYAGMERELLLVVGLALFGAVFAINSAVHSFLILSYSDQDKVAMNVGFYYMANAGGRLVGTMLSGGIYQLWGLQGCLAGSVIFLSLAFLLSFKLPGRRVAVSEIA
ncbi:organoarsenical effux MFS transporter ArsJ [Solemya velesiana gill symbiont]|uniref:MFS transporter n=1 Tax=Solemya velesiana gill symbiont TaxID=1918948 RepID=A0A1T2KTR3_9GAMM|nr:organoarsenical effux MFS transporter ArsJ [Solemya velesiana gill symbiont]OOZ36224.1 MFS transporter [Solemya velesiana gill symbiont]